MSGFFEEEHDRLLAEAPPGADHDDQNCFVCMSRLDNPRGGVMTTTPNTYTEQDLLKAVQEAVAPLKAELDTLKASQAEGEIEARIAAAKAEGETALADLQARLDAAEALANTEKAAREALEQKLADEAAEAQRQQEVAARKEARKAAVAEVGCFTEEQITAKLDSWAELSDEVFEQRMEEWREIAAARPAPTSTQPVTPATAAMTLREHTNKDGYSGMFDSLRDLRAKGIDIRNL